MIDANTTETSAIELPADAPRLRVIAGLGSAAQKTWNIRRPVTLIGSRRPAHIVLHYPGVSEAHCVLVNTGREILLKDLHTTGGTVCRNERVNLTVLKDGDVVRIGDTTVQIAIKAGAPPRFGNPKMLTRPEMVSLIHTEQQWILKEAVTLIGRHDDAPVRLDHDDVRKRHAVFFRYGMELGVFELGKDESVRVNGVACPLAVLARGDRVSIGPFGLRVGPMRAASAPVAAPSAASAVKEGEPEESPASVDLGLDVIRAQIAESWGKLNQWQSELGQEVPTDEFEPVEKPDAVASAIEATEAALRGQLHDVSCYQERLAARDRDLDRRASELRVAESECASRMAELEQKRAELARHAEELSRREHVLAQRRTRLQNSTCPACRRRQSTGE